MMERYNVLEDESIGSHLKWHLRDYSCVKKELESSTGEERGGPASHDMSLTHLLTSQKKYSILICTDFTFPKFGGVETHGYQVSQCLIERGHKVCFVSNKFTNSRTGVRYMANGLKCYHLPQIPVINKDVAFFTFWQTFPVIRQIFIREHVDICHGHQSTSVI